MNSTRILRLSSLKASHIVRFASCWSCGKRNERLVADLFCGHCKALQRPRRGVDYFRLLGVAESFDLDDGQLARRYKELQKHLHPDKFANKPKEELDISEEYSSLVNEAYNTLLNPLARGIYMMRLKGKEIPEKTEVLDKEFLMEIMEKNEEVVNAKDDAEIMRLNEENKAKIKELQKQVSAAFYEGNLQLVIKLLGVMKYYTSIDNQIQDMIRSKGIMR